MRPRMSRLMDDGRALRLRPLDGELQRRAGRIEAGIAEPTITRPSAGTPIAYCPA
jgi:hypothetical protein